MREGCCKDDVQFQQCSWTFLNVSHVKAWDQIQAAHGHTFIFLSGSTHSVSGALENSVKASRHGELSAFSSKDSLVLFGFDQGFIFFGLIK